MTRIRITHEPEAVHPSRYCGPTAGRLAAVAHARLAARRYYSTCWLAVRYRLPAFLSFAPYEENAVGRTQRTGSFVLTSLFGLTFPSGFFLFRT